MTLLLTKYVLSLDQLLDAIRSLDCRTYKHSMGLKHLICGGTLALTLLCLSHLQSAPGMNAFIARSHPRSKGPLT